MERSEPAPSPAQMTYWMKSPGATLLPRFFSAKATATWGKLRSGYSSGFLLMDLVMTNFSMGICEARICSAWREVRWARGGGSGPSGGGRRGSPARRPHATCSRRGCSRGRRSSCRPRGRTSHGEPCRYPWSGWRGGVSNAEWEVKGRKSNAPNEGVALGALAVLHDGEGGVLLLLEEEKGSEDTVDLDLELLVEAVDLLLHSLADLLDLAGCKEAIGERGRERRTLARSVVLVFMKMESVSP